MYRDMWERANDEAMEMLLQVNTEGAYFLGVVEMPKYGLKAEFKPEVSLCAPASQNCVLTCDINLQR